MAAQGVRGWKWGRREYQGPSKGMEVLIRRRLEIRHNPSQDIDLDSLVIWDTLWAEMSGQALSADVGVPVVSLPPHWLWMPAIFGGTTALRAHGIVGRGGGAPLLRWTPSIHNEMLALEINVALGP